MAGLKETYKKNIVPKLVKEFGYKSVMQAARLEKIVVNMGVGEAVQNIKSLDAAVEEIALITGQKPVVTRAKKSIAGFKLRAGMPIGCMVTLRGDRMYAFFDKLVGVAIPRIRDFKGLPTKGFDGAGNYTLGVKEEIIFPDIDIDNIDKVKGFNVTFVTTAKTDEEGRSLLMNMGMPFRK